MYWKHLTCAEALPNRQKVIQKTFKLFLPVKSFYQSIILYFKREDIRSAAMILYSFSLTWGWVISWHLYLLKISSNCSKFDEHIFSSKNFSNSFASKSYNWETIAAQCSVKMALPKNCSQVYLFSVYIP